MHSLLQTSVSVTQPDGQTSAEEKEPATSPTEKAFKPGRFQVALYTSQCALGLRFYA